MSVTIYNSSNHNDELCLNHANFAWLMSTLGLTYTYESEAMEPSEVKAAIKAFADKYFQSHACNPSYRAEKVAAWRGFFSARRASSMIVTDMIGDIGGKVVDAGPDWADLGDPFVPGTEANALRERMTGYIKQPNGLAHRCQAAGIPISLA